MAVDPAWKGLYRVGGLSLLVAGMALIVNTFLIVSWEGARLGEGESFLVSLSRQRLLFQTISGFYALATILLVPGALAIYQALKQLNRTRMFVSTGLLALAVVLQLGSVAVVYSLSRLSADYASATSEAKRAAYAAAADLAFQANAAGTTLASLLLSVASFIIAMVMLKGIFSKGTAYLGMAAGVVGFLGGIPSPAVSILGLISLMIFAIWFILVGSRLYRLV